MVLAAPAPGAGRDEGRSTCATKHQLGQEMLCPFGAGERVGSEFELLVARKSGCQLARFDTIPQTLVDDPKLGFVLDLPFAFRFQPGAAGKAPVVVGHLDPLAAVEDAPADVDFVV